jgi:ribosome-associated protein
MSILGEKVLHITNTLAIPLSELRFRFTRSGGPGGQHVNRSATRVELLFDVAGSHSLTEAQRERALKALAPYIDSDGILHLISQTFRSQLRNREEVVERFQTLMRKAMRVPKRRRPTQPSRAAQERRLASKRQRSELKRQRGSVASDD